MNPPLASVIIPSVRPQAVVLCLDALGRQTLSAGSFEVIVVDDGAKEPIRLDASKWGGHFNLRVIHQKNAGPAAARNRGVQEASGDIIAFTDDDCLPEATWLETLVAAVRKNPDALCGTITFNGLKDDVWAATSQFIIDLVYAHFNARPHDAYFLTSNNVACRRDVFLELRGFDTGFAQAGAEDREFCDRWRMSHRPLQLIPSPLLQHRHHQSLRKFVDIHYRYGRGAFFYQSKRRSRGSGSMKEDVAFHCSLLRLLGRMNLMGEGMCRGVGIFIGLAIWQFANALGFFSAMCEELNESKSLGSK